MKRNFIKVIAIVAGVTIATSAEAQWTDLNAPSLAPSGYYQHYKMAVSPDGKNIITVCSLLMVETNNKYLVSNDYGATWKTVPAIVNSAPNDMFWDGDDLFIKLPNDSTLKKSTDFGNTFTNQNPNFFSLSYTENILRSPNNKWYLVKNLGLDQSGLPQYRLFESADKGVTWTDHSAASVASIPDFYKYLVANNGNIVATRTLGGTSYSTDNGLTWTKSTFPEDPWQVKKMSNKADDGDIVASDGQKLYRSTDNGVNFALVSSTNFPANTSFISYYHNDLIAVCSDGSTHISTDDGVTFTQLTAAGAVLQKPDVVAESNSNIYVADKSGMYNYGGEVGVKELSAFAENISVYPNPINNILNIEVKDISTSLNVQIVDVLGKTITTQNLNASTNSIDVSNLVNGVYFVKSANGGAVKFIKE